MQSCDLLLCEDTRRSQTLLYHYKIKKKLESYHSFNESQRIDWVIRLLQEGKTIGLLSDGGCPAICDPGATLITACIKEKIPFTSIPGPAALIQALILSGFPCSPFQFFGFMPRKESEILSLLPMTLSFPGTSIFYESPQRLADTLSYLATLAPSTPVAIARELTKLFEEIIRMTAIEACAYFRETPPKGEIVLLIQGGEDPFSGKDPKSLVEELQATYGISLTDAIKTASHLLKTPKQSVYKLFHSEK